MTMAVTVVTISGHRQAAVTDSPDFRSWHALAERLGRARCVWAGPRLESEHGPMSVVRRPRRTGPRSLLWAVRAAWTGVRLARAATRRGETVILNGAEPWGWLSAWLVARCVRRPWLMDVHADYLGLPVASLGRWRKVVLERAVVAFARRATARRVVAQSMVDALGRRGIPAALVPPRLQPVWQEPPRRERPPLAGPTVVLLTVGRLVPSKGYDLLLTAMAALATERPEVRLRIVGDGPSRDALVRQAQRLGVSGVVDFAGAATPDEVRAELARADLFVISSRDEGLPRTLLEATAAGVPVVTTNVGGIPAAAANWPTVSLVAPDPSEIADGVRRTLADPPGPGHLEAVRRDVLRTYGFATNLDALAALYRTVVET
jgi:glycosyltransferase involved in cell wall biosynthesis